VSGGGGGGLCRREFRGWSSWLFVRNITIIIGGGRIPAYDCKEKYIEQCD